MKKYYWIETYGCQMNTAESNAIITDLQNKGWEEASSEDLADFVLINTCSVRQHAEDKVISKIGQLRRRHCQNGNQCR